MTIRERLQRTPRHVRMMRRADQVTRVLEGMTAVERYVVLDLARAVVAVAEPEKDHMTLRTPLFAIGAATKKKRRSGR